MSINLEEVMEMDEEEVLSTVGSKVYNQSSDKKAERKSKEPRKMKSESYIRNLERRK